ncbi:AraC family transcriptional regulator [Aureivirga marina]|uniref:AraC family transcriptional regulator n=1 Tax=Aureivirga marina TaxID=1182451 RepID=UPI0018CA03FD|nr:AraC family transcriptional regulator [Aureivirga marina]
MGIQGYSPKKAKDAFMISGDIPVVNPFTLHKSENLDIKGFQYRMFYIDSELFLKVSQEVFGKEILPQFQEFAIRDVYLEKNLIQLHKILFQDSYTLLQKQNYLYEILTYMVKNHTIIGKENQLKLNHSKNIVSKVEDFLRVHYHQKIELQDLVEIANLSPYHLNRIFAKEKGIPPHQFLINLRLNKARKLLKTSKNVTEIGLEVGFFDQSHFTRNFKNFIGITPKKYQLAIR